MSARPRHRWKCRCGQRGVASSLQMACAELIAHDQLAHLEPARRAAATEAMLHEAAQ